MKFRKCALSCRVHIRIEYLQRKWKNTERERKKPLILRNEFFHRICCRAFLFNPCLSQPNKFVIVVYTTDMIFTLYRCDDWQIGFECVFCAFSLVLWLSHPIPFRFCLASFFVCLVSRFNEQKMIHCDCLSSVLFSLSIIKSKPYAKHDEFTRTHAEKNKQQQDVQNIHGLCWVEARMLIII